MNERIQQMIYSLNEKAGVHWINEDKIKFAESIVRECIFAVEDAGGIDKYHYTKAISRHFGVEE